MCYHRHMPLYYVKGRPVKVTSVTPKAVPAEVVVEDSTPDEAADVAVEAEEAVEAPEFDPALHTVSEVVAYAEAHPDDVEAILADEKAGKNRATAVKGLEELLNA